jgi:nucleoside 2-deoxyribosyltransferase
MKVYLAGPDVFLPNTGVAAEKKALVAAAGHIPLYPLDAASPVDAATAGKPEVAAAIFAANVAMIRAADVVLANLTPFRGPSADVGTAWEAGFGHALGKPVFGYSNVAVAFEARTRAILASGGDGMEVEDFGLASDNLMLHFSLAGYFAHQAPAGGRWRDLESFKAALAAVGADWARR